MVVLKLSAEMPEPGGPGGHWPPPIFGQSVNPIPPGEDRLSPPITTGTPNIFHPPVSLECNFEQFLQKRAEDLEFREIAIKYPHTSATSKLSRGSPNSTIFAHPGYRTVVKIVLSGDRFSTKNHDLCVTFGFSKSNFLLFFMNSIQVQLD